MNQPLPPDIESICRLVQIDGNNNMAKRLREYIADLQESASLRGALEGTSVLISPEDCPKCPELTEPAPLYDELGRMINFADRPIDRYPDMPGPTVGDVRDFARLSYLETLTKPAGKKMRLQIFFEGTLRDWIDKQLEG